MGDSQLERTAREFRAAILAHDKQAARQLIDRYGVAWVRIKARLDVLASEISDAKVAGEPVNTSWLFQQQRLKLLQVQVEQEIGEFSRYAGDVIASGQDGAVGMAQEHARGLALASLGNLPADVTVSWAPLPRGALQDLIGYLSNGAPLSDLLDELGPDAAKSVGDALVTGVATGLNPRVVARMTRKALGGNLVRALTISRTEILRSYRTSTLRGYRANSDVVKGWIWTADLSDRTCMACIVENGSFHTLDEELDDHPRGRCSAIPETKSWEELGIPGIQESRPVIQKGADWFAALPEAKQAVMMGPAKFAAWKAGEFDLADLVGRSHSHVWGSMRYERSLKDIVGEDQVRKWTHPAS